MEGKVCRIYGGPLWGGSPGTVFDRYFTFLSAAWNFHKETMGGYSGVCVPDSLLLSDVFEEYREKV